MGLNPQEVSGLTLRAFFTNGGDFSGVFALTDHSLQFILAAVPEPGTGMTLLLAGLILSVIRRIRSNLKSKKM